MINTSEIGSSNLGEVNLLVRFGFFLPSSTLIQALRSPLIVDWASKKKFNQSINQSTLVHVIADD